MTPEQEKAFEALAMRQASLERRQHELEVNLPRLVTAVLTGFFKAAAENQVNPSAFEFAHFDPETDDIQHSLQIIGEPTTGDLIFMAYVGPDAWVGAEWIMKGSIIYDRALDFMLREDICHAHVKLVNVTTAPVQTQELSHE